MKRAHNAVKINSVNMARGKLRITDGNHKVSSSNGSFKSGEMFTTEFDINETPPSARTLLTKGYIQDEINTFSGATVSTRGRFMTEQEKLRCPNERSLYLYIQGYSKHNVDLAVQKINEIIKTEYRSSLNRPSRFTNAPPPLISLQSGISSVEKICIGIDNSVPGFDLQSRIIGDGGANLLYIRGETGATVTLRGRGSQFIESSLGTESPEPLHLYIEYPNPSALQKAKELAINLIQTIQSELQSFIQNQPPPVQSQQVMQQPHIQQIQQAQFQTMNIGALGQPNVVTIQHQDIIQHPQSSVVTLPATILTATVAGTPAPAAPIPPSGVQGPPHTGLMAQNEQTQEIQTFVPPTSVSQMQLIGPPPTISQVQYQIHSGQPIQIQGIPPSGSQTSPQPVTQMYVMSQPPPQGPVQQNFMSSSSASIAGAVSYVYTQPNMQRPPTPLQNVVETVNVNLQHPPPSSASINVSQQPPPPPSLLHLHFPPPFPPNQPPPPISQTYQIQYQQVQAPPTQNQTQFVLQHGEHVAPPPPPQLQQNHEPPHSMAQHIPQYDGQPPPQIQMPPPEIHQQETSQEHVVPPQPVPPPQMVPPPVVNQMQQHSMNIVTNVPPPTHGPPPQQAPWVYQGQEQVSFPQPQGQVQMTSSNIQMQNATSPEMQSQVQYHSQQVHYQNGQLQAQVHYAVQPPPTHHNYDQNSDVSEQQKSHGIKRRYSDVEGLQESAPHQGGWPPMHRHGTGEGDRPQQILQCPPPSGPAPPHSERNKMLMPPPHPGDKRVVEQLIPGQKSGHEQNLSGDPGGNGNNVPPPLPFLPPPLPNSAMSRQGHNQPRVLWNRPPPVPREGEHHLLYQTPPPINIPPPHIRFLRGQTDGSGSPGQNSTAEHSPNVDHNQVPPYSMKKPPPCNTFPLVQSICNPPPPPPPPPPSSSHQTRQQGIQHHQPPVLQNYQSPPWMN